MSTIERKKDEIQMDIENNGKYAFRANEHGFRDKMFKHFEEGDFCDVTLKAGKDNKMFPVHRVVLSAASEYFSALFTNEMKEKYQTEILLEDFDGVTLLNLIEYCYKGKIRLTEDNIDGLLAATHMFRFTEWGQRCTDHYKNILNSSSCLGIWALAKQYDLETLMNLAINFALANFMDVVKSDEFKYMKAELLSEFLSSENVNVDSEEDVFHAMVVWIEFDLSKRLPHLQNLIQNIRVGQFNRSFLEDELLFWCQKINDLQLYENILNRHSTGQASARKSTTFGRLLAVGGSTWDMKNDCLSIERYCPLTNTWKRFHDIPGFRHSFNIVHINNNELIIIGGKNMSYADSATVECLNLKTLTMRDLQPMQIGRYGFGAAFSEGFIYVIGGSNRLARTSVERYDVKLNQWTEVASLTKDRMYAATAILSGIIFAIGGEDSSTTTTNSVECYVPEANKWVSISPMIQKRSAPGSGVANNILYVYGGGL